MVHRRLTNHVAWFRDCTGWQIRHQNSMKVDSRYKLLLVGPSFACWIDRWMWNCRCCFAARERQILELCVLQVHLYFWRNERSGDGRDRAVVHLVLNSWLSAHTRAALQGSLWICKPHSLLRSLIMNDHYGLKSSAYCYLVLPHHKVFLLCPCRDWFFTDCGLYCRFHMLNTF